MHSALLLYLIVLVGDVGPLRERRLYGRDDSVSSPFSDDAYEEVPLIEEEEQMAHWSPFSTICFMRIDRSRRFVESQSIACLLSRKNE